MKTLKKVLCLVLALVMVVGTMAISAAAYTDEISEDYEEAVAVLSAIKVIDGYGDDVFGAKDGVTRAQALAFVVRAMLTRSTANKLNASAAAFADVTDDWAKGVVSYAVAEGMANGWNGNFAPNDPVTGYAMAKFALTALDIEGEYTGTNWENNVLLAANKAGLLEGMEDDFDLSANLNREQAAQLAFNMIEYAPNGVKSAYIVKDKSGTPVYEGTDAVTALLMKQSDANNTLTRGEIKSGSLGDTLYGLQRNTTFDAFGRSNVTWTSTKDSKLSVVVDKDAVYTGKGKVAIKTIASALGATAGKNVALTVVEDGVRSDATITANAATAGTVGDVGSVVEVYKTATGYDVIVINTYVDTVKSVTKAVAATATAAATKRFVTLNNSDLTYTTESFAKGDVVIYTKANNVVKSMAIADTLTGKVTAKGTGYVRIDGVQKYISKNSTAAAEALAVGAVGYTYYLDGQGNIIAAAATTSAAATYEKIYVVGFDAAVKTNSTGTNLFDQASSESWTIQAKVINLKTGELSVVDVATATGVDNKLYLANANGSANTTKIVTGTEPAIVKGYVTTGYNEYAVVDGKYVFVQHVDSVSATLNKANAQAIDGKYANNKTVVYVITGNKSKVEDSTSFTVKITTGLANFPTTAATYAVAAYDADNDNNLVAIYAIKGAEAATAAVNYSVYLGAGEEVIGSDGKPAQLVKFTTGEYEKAAGITLAKENEGSVYNVTVTNGKILSVAKNIDADGKSTTVSKVSDGYFTDASGEVKNLASNVVILDATDDYKTAELEADDYVTYFTNSTTKLVEFIVISKAPIA